jgi:hypothetical protein
VKTFEEAFATVHMVKDASTFAVNRDLAERSVSMAREIGESDLAAAMVETVWTSFGLNFTCRCAACTDSKNAMMTAFVAGIRTGIEMERQEMPGL